MTLKALTLVKYHISDVPENCQNLFVGMTFIYFGEVTNMAGHSVCQDIKTGKPYILHTENLVELTEDEL